MPTVSCASCLVALLGMLRAAHAAAHLRDDRLHTMGSPTKRRRVTLPAAQRQHRHPGPGQRHAH